MKKIRSKKESKNQMKKRLDREIDLAVEGTARIVADRAIATVAEWIEHREPVYPDGSRVMLGDIFGG